MTQLIYLFNSIILNDAAEPWQLGFQDSVKILAVLSGYFLISFHTICWDTPMGSGSNFILEKSYRFELSAGYLYLLRDYTYELYINYVKFKVENLADLFYSSVAIVSSSWSWAKL